MGPVQRAASGLDEGELRAVRAQRQQFGEQHRQRDDDAPAMPPAISGVRLARTRATLVVAAEPVRQHEAGQHIDLEQRDLVAPEHDQGGRRAGKRAVAPDLRSSARDSRNSAIGR